MSSNPEIVRLVQEKLELVNKVGKLETSIGELEKELELARTLNTRLKEEVISLRRDIQGIQDRVLSWEL